MRVNTSFINDRQLPMVVEADSINDGGSELFDLFARQGAFLRESLLLHGAILFRGFNISSVGEFEDAVRCFSDKELINYAGGVSPRSTLGGSVYTSTEYPSHLSLALHNELSYSRVFPGHLYFFCVNPAAYGGETTLGDSRRILRNMPPEISDLFQRHGIRYVRNLSDHDDSGYTWQDAFETDSRKAAEKHCARIGADFEWQPGGWLKVGQLGPAIITHPQTGEQVWFNQAHGFHPSELEPAVYTSIISNGGRFRLESYLGDGSPIDVKMLDEIRRVLSDETIKHKWRQGDLLILDNVLVSHGRRPFSGPRQIALAMT